MRNLSETDRRRDNSRVQSGFGKKIENWVGRELAYPDNVLHLATECSNRGHSATFPVELPGGFIKLFTQPGDMVLDPFIGSGTTAVAAKQSGRRCIGIEIDPAYVQIAQEHVRAVLASQPSINIIEFLAEQETSDEESAMDGQSADDSAVSPIFSSIWTDA